MPHGISPDDGPMGELKQPKVGVTNVEFHPALLESTFLITSLLCQLRDQWRHPIPRAPRDWYLEVRGLPVTDMRPWYRGIQSQVRFLFERTPAWPTGITSQPIAVRNIWQDNRWQPGSLLNLLLLHVLAFVVLTIPFVMAPPKHVVADAGTITRIYYSPADVPALANRLKQTSGGSGGGNHSPKPASVGRIPPFARAQIVPPTTTIKIVTPLLAATPTLIGPPELKPPEIQTHINWGDPNGVASPNSDGPGKNGGIGDGDNGGVGNKEGPGYGPGDMGPYSPRFGGVTAAKPVYSPPPNYSEDARKAKLQGTVILSLVVDAHGNPIDIRVVRSLGMGLDENAVDAARTWKFTPGTRNGVPVPVRMLLEVQFRLF